MVSDIDFQTSRDQWALKAPLPSRDRVEAQGQMDRQANPHNENYHNKQPRRSEVEIVSDLSYTYANSVLYKQYGQEYVDWLNDNGYVMRWNQIFKGQRHLDGDVVRM